MRGWLEAAGCVTCIGVLSLLYAIGNTLGAHPIAFILYAVLVSAIATLAVVGTGSQAMAIMLHPLSWAVGLGIILLEVFYYQTLAYVPPAHGNVMLRVGIPIAMIVGWMLLRRRTKPLAIVGAVAIVIATVIRHCGDGARCALADGDRGHAGRRLHGRARLCGGIPPVEPRRADGSRKASRHGLDHPRHVDPESGGGSHRRDGRGRADRCRVPAWCLRPRRCCTPRPFSLGAWPAARSSR